VWQNTGNGFLNATPTVAPGLPGVNESSVAWGDYDNDGRLDFLLTGYSDSGRIIAQIWRNIGPTSHPLPASPTDLAVALIGSAVTFRWNPASDPQPPASVPSYNLRVGTTPGGSDIVSPHASAAGQRRLPALGNAQQSLSFPLAFPLTGPIYWSVQAVDPAFAGSPFAPESSFNFWLLPGPASGLVPGDANGDGVVSPTELDAVAQRYWGPTARPAITNLVTDGQGLWAMTLTNAAAWDFSVEVSTNLVDWEWLGPAWPVLQFADPGATNAPYRFYRLSWP